MSDSSTLKKGKLTLRLKRTHRVVLTALFAKGNTEQKQTARTQNEIEIHQEDRTEMEKQLVGFDLNCKNGPCVGLSRLERWDRAAHLNLNPPQHIRTLLLAYRTKKYVQECLFAGSVI